MECLLVIPYVVTVTMGYTRVNRGHHLWAEYGGAGSSVFGA